MHPIELLSLCKIDMSKPDVIQDALNVFGSLIEDFKKIVVRNFIVKIVGVALIFLFVKSIQA